MNDHSKERLKELKQLPLERKVGFTAARIIEWHNHFQGKVYVSFSGGKDSTVLLHIARTLFPDIKAVFVDTGLEYPEIKQFVGEFDNVDIVRPKISFLQVIEQYGWPVISKEVAQVLREYSSCKTGVRAEQLGLIPKSNRYAKHYDMSKYQYLADAPFKISDRCCEIMKKRPAKEYEKVTGLHPIIATMTDESFLRQSEWLKSGCNGFSSTRPISKPMSFWTEQDVLHYIQQMNIRIAPVYGDIVFENNKYRCTKCQRTGCVFCLFGIKSDAKPNRIQRLLTTHPQLWDYCINRLGMRQVMDYINEPYQ